MSDYEIRLTKPIDEDVMTRLKVEQGYNLWGLEITWTDKTVHLKNVSEFQEIAGISRAFRANAKFIQAFLCELHGANGRVYKNGNVIDAYYGTDEPSLADDIWSSIKRWFVIAFK